MQRGRIIDEIPGIVHAASGCGDCPVKVKQLRDIFLCKFVEHARIIDVANWLSVALRTLMSWSISDVKCQQATGWQRAVV